MTAPACGSCGAPVADARLCQGCTRDLAELLLLAASIAGDLDDAVARLLKRGSGGRSSSPEPPLPVDLAASEAAHELRVELAVTVAELLKPGEDVKPDTRLLARWLVAHLARIRQHDRAPQMLDAIRHRVHQALTVIDRPAERAPAGQCEACGTQLLAELGADEVRCGCGILTVALQAKRRERAAAADVLGTPAAVSDALAAIGIAVPRGTITSWVSRGRIALRPGGMVAMSEVLAMKAQSSQPKARR
jgi:hypothetical protein